MILDGPYLFLHSINHFKYRGTTSALDGNFGELKYKFEGGWIPCLWAANEKNASMAGNSPKANFSIKMAQKMSRLDKSIK